MCSPFSLGHCEHPDLFTGAAKFQSQSVDSLTPQLSQAFELIWGWGGRARLLFPQPCPQAQPPTPKECLQRSSKTLQQNLHGAVNEDLVAFSCNLVRPVFSPSFFFFSCQCEHSVVIVPKGDLVCIQLPQLSHLTPQKKPSTSPTPKEKLDDIVP